MKHVLQLGRFFKLVQRAFGMFVVVRLALRDPLVAFWLLTLRTRLVEFKICMNSL
jgi:hypothetical protein